jgi:RNA polymerase sigma factor (sigma-70 family)
MLLQINGVGKQKIPYKSHDTISFDNLDSYLLLAKKAISKFAKSLASKMLKDEDAISSVANAIMMADWRWDENYKNKQGTKKTKYSYRNQCAIWSIQTYLSKEYMKNKKFNKVYSLDYSADYDSGIYDFIEDTKNMRPEENACYNEKTQDISQLIEIILNLECLTDRQKDYIKLYYIEEQTFENIGKKYNITREAARQGLNKAICLVREVLGQNE